MLQYLLMSRSLTYAQRAARALERAGVSAVVSRIPMGVTDSGCSYCVKIPEKKLTLALKALRAAELDPLRIYAMTGDGSVSKVSG